MLSNCRVSTKLSKLSALVAIVFALGFTSTEVKAQPNGELLFKGNCASCHRATAEPLTGPGLKGARERWADKEGLIYEWIKNPKKVLDSGDPYANEIYNQYKSSGIMPAQAVSNEDIDAILDYVESYVAPAPKEDVAAVGTGGSQDADSSSATWMIVIASLLLVVIFSVVGTKRALRVAVAAKKGEEIPEETYLESFKSWISKNKILTAIVVVFIVVTALRAGWYQLTEIGVYQGYNPEQPIWFSHKVHAGENKINCVYCHNSAEKSKHAGIPTVNVCMNCHSAINKGSITGETEIAKIYEAAGWDPQKREYTGEEKPIKWVKVHNLPDHVYFNHSQHVVVCKLECQECHGEVQDVYDTGTQFAPLTMGWCIDCHGEKEVQMAGNGYYDEMHARMTKEELKKYLNGDEKITVRDLGGWECAKCHY